MHQSQQHRRKRFPISASRQSQRIRKLHSLTATHPSEGRGGAATDKVRLSPPTPPPTMTAFIASSPRTSEEVLWRIAIDYPRLRRWIIANTRASPELLEYVAQAGGPGVRNGFDVLFEGVPDESQE